MHLLKNVSWVELRRQLASENLQKELPINFTKQHKSVFEVWHTINSAW